MRKNIMNRRSLQIRVLYLLSILTISFSLNGCAKLASTPAGSQTAVVSPDTTSETQSVSPESSEESPTAITPLPEEEDANNNESGENAQAENKSPAPTNSADTSSDDTLLLTADEAKMLIEEKLDMRKYAVTLLSDTLSIAGNHYYQFVVSEQALAIEPTLIVNKYDGQITCLAADGTITSYSSYPLYNPLTDAVCDWNGIYKRHVSESETNATLLMAQGDSTSFEFCIDAINSSLNIGQLYGIATIEGNTATFTDDQGFSLIFKMTDDGLTILESGLNIYAGHNVTFNGDYTYEQQFTLKDKITSDKAIGLLKTLAPGNLGLPNSIINYQVTSDDIILNVNDKICYSISVYDTSTENEVLMNTYYVAIDGSVIYRFDRTSLNSVRIYEAS
ncbi:MAG: hypothetical protein E7256_04805 [Lachnospiraceae bacterium]|nr:hypothetical protein [Lachnospiraceae bacterium]